MTAAIISAAAPTCRLGTASVFLNIVPARPLLQIGWIAPDGVVAPEGLVGRVDPAEFRALGGVPGDQLVPGALHGGDDLGRPPVDLHPAVLHLLHGFPLHRLPAVDGVAHRHHAGPVAYRPTAHHEAITNPEVDGPAQESRPCTPTGGRWKRMEHDKT